MKSGTARNVAGAIFLILFALIMLLVIAVLWGIIPKSAAVDITHFFTEGKMFLRVLAGIGILAVLAVEFYVFLIAKSADDKKAKSPMNFVGKTPAGTAYISSAAIDAMARQCVKKNKNVKDSACIITPCENGGISIELKLKIYKDANLPLLCSSLQNEIKSYIESTAGIPVREITVSVVDIAENTPGVSEKRVR